ncbi:cytochrome c [Sphingobium sp. D43FB]|uniref:c-type cytochrome n=1 Tax=Sphingobium sp. D43FB TaxID=2017595 RepID=UPI000BB574AB|nr:cytochrome c [Sphingobium sp. D43FB]PBN42924.1 hypothetical protein SxD43FB_13915 [Sphingobium sp. D43FB]
MPTKIVLACLISLTAACGAMASGQAKPVGVADRAENTAAKRGMAFARSHCAACHAVGTGMSPKPEAPSFEAIVNTPGLTAETLKPWLRDSHNYPEIMNFAIAPTQIDDLAAYMLTLKNRAYRPPIQ